MVCFDDADVNPPIEDTSLSHISLYTSYIQDILGQPVSLSSTEIPGTVVLFDLRDLPKSESPATSRHESILFPHHPNLTFKALSRVFSATRAAALLHPFVI